MTRLGEILPSIVETLLDRVDDPTNYEPCPHCHRPSWSFLQWSVQQAAKDERERIEWEQFVASLDGREEQFELIRRMLLPAISYRPQLRVVRQ